MSAHRCGQMGIIVHLSGYPTASVFCMNCKKRFKSDVPVDDLSEDHLDLALKMIQQYRAEGRIR